jgi:hypothetical protein
VLAYNLQYDGAQGIWTDLTESLVTSFGVTQAIKKGETYSFRYRARNGQGWGEFSDELKLIAARRTDQVSAAVT